MEYVDGGTLGTYSGVTGWLMARLLATAGGSFSWIGAALVATVLCGVSFIGGVFLAAGRKASWYMLISGEFSLSMGDTPREFIVTTR